MPVSELKDWRGNTIAVGDVILYAVKHSTSVEVNEAVVKGFGEDTTWNGQAKATIHVEWIRSSGGFAEWRKVKLVTITNVKSVTLLEKYRNPEDFGDECRFGCGCV